MSTEKNSSRWWEFYAVRYTVGTIVGAIIVYFICSNNELLKPALLGMKPDNLQNTYILLLAAYGFCFCYIASGPILVLHTGRFLINESEIKSSWKRILILLFPPFIIVCLLFLFTEENHICISGYLAFFLASIALWGQYYIVIRAAYNRKKIYSFYKKLSQKRMNEESDIVESYKHLREHGNAFMIIVCEMILGILLYISSDLNLVFYKETILTNSFSPILIIFILWVYPPASTWAVGTYLEYYFVKEKDNKQNHTKSE